MVRRAAKDCIQYALALNVAGAKALNPKQDPASRLLDVDFHLRAWLAQVIADCPKSRAEIAAGMTDAMFGPNGEGEVTRQQLDSWTRREGAAWRFPASHLPAFEQVTGDLSILQRLAALVGCVVLTGDQARLAQLGSLAALRRRLDREEAEILKDLPAGLIKDILKNGGAP